MADPPTATKPPPPDDAGDPNDTGLETKPEGNQTAVTAQWPGLKQIYLGASGEQLGFDPTVGGADYQIFNRCRNRLKELVELGCQDCLVPA